MALTAEDKIFLLKLARQTLEKEFEMPAGEEYLKAMSGDVADSLKNKDGVFVTLEKAGRLRGCIGHITGVLPLYKGVMENAAGAAFEDPRFEPLEKNDLGRTEIEISVLSAPKKLDYKNASDLLEKLQTEIDGVVLSKGFSKATYLPQVWEMFKDKKTFLSSLCVKAGLPVDAWESSDVKIETYRAEVFKE